MIQLTNVTKLYTSIDLDTYALNKIDLTIDAGESLAICGPSGSGKSTLLSVLGGLIKPDEGNYFYKGTDLSKANRKTLDLFRRENLGFIYQDFRLIDDLTAFENVSLPLRYRDNLTSREIRRRAEDILERVEMGHRKFHYPGQLSGGQQQRISIARALIVQPSLLLADEPTGNLDAENGANILRLLAEVKVQSGATLCIVTHDSLVASQASRVVNMIDGSLSH